MARDPLAVLLRLRGIGLDAARRDLAGHLRAEAAAAERVVVIATTIAQEIAVETARPQVAAVPDSFAAWHRRIQVTQCQVEATAQQAAAATATSRQSVNEARAAARALEAALADARRMRDDALARQEQRALDEAAALCVPPRRWSG